MAFPKESRARKDALWLAYIKPSLLLPTFLSSASSSSSNQVFLRQTRLVDKAPALYTLFFIINHYLSSHLDHEELRL